MARRTTFAVVVPAYNEEVVIDASLRSLTKAINKQHIYVVSDGSVDQTAKLARQTTANVLPLRKNVGKARALEKLIKRFDLTKRYRYIMFFDADTKLGPNYFKEIKKFLANQPACIVGTVSSQPSKLISAYRVFEYGFSHRFYKNAQNAMGAIVIAPGCTSVYRADVLEKLAFGGDTLTEDFDLTIQIYEKKLGKVVYCPRARVITQDPPTLRDYWNQIGRWNTGYWQNFFLHKLYLPKNRVNIEILLLMGDFLYWLAVLALAAFNPSLFVQLYGTALAIMFIISLAVISIERQFWALPYAPLFGFFQLTNLVSFVTSFFRAVASGRRVLAWNKLTRYAH